MNSGSERVAVGDATVELLQGDITTLDVDAIVTAANESLLGGGGVDGAIHRAAGPLLLAECQKVGWCDTGEAVITMGGLLPARHVIHTVGPIWEGGMYGEAEVLAKAYRSVLAVAEANHVQSLAFPAISTGTYGYPIEEAAQVALATVIAHLRAGSGLQRVIFVLFTEDDYLVYCRLLSMILAGVAS